MTATIAPGHHPGPPDRPSIPITRLVKVELRKMFNTRSGFWMLISIGVLSVIATGAVIIFASDSRHLRELREGDRVPDVGDLADDRDPGRHE